jgi:predicted nuclease with TOPRIM domain
MDDEHGDSGFGSLAWYQMGRWSERSSQRTREWMDSIHNPVVAKSHYDEAVRLNQALVAADRHLNGLVDQLQGQLNASRADYERLREWANQRDAEATALRTKCTALEALGKEKDALISDIWNRWSDLRWNRDPSSEGDF